MPVFNRLCRFVAALALLLAPGLAWAKDGAQTYSVPKEGRPASAAKAPGKPLAWTVPGGWEEQAGSRIRLGQFAVPGPDGTKAELGVTMFPGNVGGELANVNRWRDELGLVEIGEKEVASSSVAVGSESGKLYSIEGASQSTSVAWVMKDGNSYFFKLRGDKAAVAAARPAMVEFLKSVQFQATPGINANEMILGSSNPHAGMDSASMPAGHPDVSKTADASTGAVLPSWNIPAHWKEQAASVALKSFSIADEKAGAATASISMFPGEAGGTLANVNRWRGQIGLKPVAEAELASITKIIDVAGAKATFMDASGTDAKTGKPARLAAIMAPQGGNTWFYKLLGDGPVVERELTNLVNLAQSARQP